MIIRFRFKVSIFSGVYTGKLVMIFFTLFRKRFFEALLRD